MIAIGMSPAGGGGAGGGSISVAAYSDAGFTNPITSADWGDTVYVRAENASGITPVEYLFVFVDNSDNAEIIYQGANANSSWVVNVYVGNGELYVFATEDAAEPKSWVGKSIEFEVVSNFWLDIYPNAILAVGTTKLRSLFTNDTINVRRSSDNSSDDFTPITGVVPYIDGNSAGTSSTLSSFVGASNGLVTKLYDQSTYGNDVLNTTMANQPILMSSGSFIPIRTEQNGIEFDGSNDFLAVALNTVPNFEWVGFGEFVTVNAVVNFIDVTSLRSLFTARSGGSIAPIILSVESGKVKVVILGSSFESFTSTATISVGVTYTIGVTINGQTLKIYINGILDSTHTITNTVASRVIPTATNSLICISGNGSPIPSTHYLRAYLGTLVVEKGVYSDAEMLDVHNKFGS